MFIVAARAISVYCQSPLWKPVGRCTVGLPTAPPPRCTGTTFTRRFVVRPMPSSSSEPPMSAKGRVKLGWAGAYLEGHGATRKHTHDGRTETGRLSAKYEV